jgi:hypothetical protein
MLASKGICMLLAMVKAGKYAEASDLAAMQQSAS